MNSLQTVARQSIGNMIRSVNNLQNLVNRHVDVNSCTANLNQGIVELIYNYTTNLTSCPFNEANRGIKLINDGIEYLSFMVNLTTSTPISVSNCYSGNYTRRCLIDLVAENSKAIVGARGKMHKIITNVQTFVLEYNIFIALCYVDASFAAQAHSMLYGIDVTACLARKLAG